MKFTESQLEKAIIELLNKKPIHIFQAKELKEIQMRF